MLTRLFKRLFATTPGPPAFSVTEYKGFSIRPDPIREGELWRVAAEVSKSVEGQLRVHRLIRADTLPDRDAAAQTALAKARLVIDQQGEALFGPLGALTRVGVSRPSRR